MNGSTSSQLIQNPGFSNSISTPRPNNHSEITHFIFITSIKHCQIAACLISDHGDLYKDRHVSDPTNNLMISSCFRYNSVSKDLHHISLKIN